MNDEQPAVDPQQNLDKAARKQVPGPVTEDRKQPGSVNIWSGRQLGPRGERGSRTAERRHKPSQYRCKPKLDTGRTKGSQGNVNTFCIFFAKGMCYQGADCPFLHRLPTSADNEAMARSTGADIFGREKLPDDLDNRKGAGSYERDMTTLYVHYGGAGGYAVPQLRHLLLQNFGEFGPVRGMHIVPSKTIAFIRYHWRVTAEFAHVAMDQQSLQGSTLHEVLSVRWANDDPNPTAVVGRKRAALDAAEAAAMSAWDALPAEEKRARMAMAQQARAQRVSAVASALPEPLLEAASGSVQGDTSFDAWRGFSSGGEYHHHHQQQQQEASGYGLQAGASEQQQQQPEMAAADWQAYYAAAEQQQQQQQQQEAAGGQPGASAAGSWYQGWKQRHKPETLADQTLAAVRGAAGGGDEGGGTQPVGGLGLLLAGYGSDSEPDEDAV